MDKAIGLLLILAGIIALAWGGVFYSKTQQAAHLGAIEMQTRSSKSIQMHPFAGSVALLAGISLIGISKAG